MSPARALARRFAKRAASPSLAFALAVVAPAPPVLAAPNGAPAGVTSAPGAIVRPRAAPPGRVRGPIPLFFTARPSADGSRRMEPARPRAPVTIRFADPPTARDVDALRAAGALVPLRRDGSPRGYGSTLYAELPPAALEAVAAMPGVERIRAAGSPFLAPRPLDAMAIEVQAADAWRHAPDGAAPLTGAGITICDIDSGIDPFHPLFFRADGGTFAWVDTDGDGVFTPGVDGVDRAGDGQVATLRVLNLPISHYSDDTPLFGSDDPSFHAGMDFLYADLNGSGAREHGPAAGFGDTDPSFGEPLYVIDDVNGDGALGPDEKLVALGSSKIRSVLFDGTTYRRGENLSMLPVSEEFAHGAGASAVLAGGVRGLTRLVGMAPDAELVVAVHDESGTELELADFCIDEGARVVLHEYAPWVGYPLDGSSDLEEYIDETAAKGVVHVNPAGNLSTSKKLMKRSLPPGKTTVVPVEVPAESWQGPYRLMGLSLLWRDPSRDLAVVLEDPLGATKDLPATDGDVLYEKWQGGLMIYAGREDSSRGTARIDVYVLGAGPPNGEDPPLPDGTWKLSVTDPAPAGSKAVELIAYVLDDLSGWGGGIRFTEHVSEDHLIGHPGTADSGIAVAAYTGHGFQGGTPGVRAAYSGRGHRIDGEPILSIAAPDDPITAGIHEDGSPGGYIVYGGTSGASPHVAGVAALLLQANPNRTGLDVRAAIRAGALADDVVGAAPNDDYGYGKLRAYRSLFGSDPPGGSAPAIAIAPAKAVVREEIAVPIEVTDPDEPAEALVLDVDRDYDGVFEERLAEPVLRATLEAPGRLVAKVRVTDGTGRQAAALAVIDVSEPIDEPADQSPSPSTEDDGGCAMAPRSGRGAERIGWWIALGALAAIARRRRAARRALAGC